MYLINLNKLQKDEIIILNQIYLSEKKDYVNFLDSIITKQDKLLGFSPVFSRDNQVAKTYYFICIFKLIFELKKKKQFTKILTDKYDLYLFLKKNFYKEKQNINIEYTGSFYKFILYNINFVVKIKKLAFLIYFTTIQLVSKIFFKKEKYDFSKYVLVDTTLLKSSFKNNIFLDRFYGNLYQNFKDKIIFTDENLLFFQSFKSLKILKKQKIKFLFKFQVLKLKDYLFSLKCVCFPSYKNLDQINNYKGIDLKTPLQIDLNNAFCNLNFFFGILNYKFFQNLKLLNINFKLIINWNENQPADKGFVLGVKTFHPKSKLIGYCSAFVNFNYFFNRQPLKAEYINKYIPDTYYLITGKYSELLKQFCGRLNIYEGPLLRFDIQNTPIEYTSKVKNILITLPIEKTETKNILRFISNIDYNSHNITIKFHPNFSKSEIKKYKKYFFNTKLSNESFEKLLTINDIIISSSSSTVIESIFKGKYVISPINSKYLVDSPAANFFSSDLFSTAYSPKEVQLIISKISRNLKNNLNKIIIMRDILIKDQKKKTLQMLQDVIEDT
tara:strand:+ start:531 stop:2198 length:1668 start_codon:yes stop_codon:yes gene_type:complete